jgi:hypothetical protein
MVEGARSEHGDDRAGEDGCGDLGPRSCGTESEDDAEWDRGVEGPLVGDAAETRFQLADSGRFHKATVPGWAGSCGGIVALLQCLMTKSESGLRKSAFPTRS